MRLNLGGKGPYGGENEFEIRAHLVKCVNFCQMFVFSTFDSGILKPGSQYVAQLRAASVFTRFVLSGSEHDVCPTTPLISTCSYRGCDVVRKSVTMDVDDDFRLLLVVVLSLALRSL